MLTLALLALEWGEYLLFISYVSWVLANIMTTASRNAIETDEDTAICIMFWQLIVYLSYHIGADKVTGDSWQLVSAIHGECDTLMVWYFVSDTHIRVMPTHIFFC
jgi:hypothetical protein